MRNTDNVLFGHCWLGNAIANDGARWSNVKAICNKTGTAYIEGAIGASAIYESVAMKRTAARFSGDKPIYRMYMYVGGGGLYPAGTTIEIWGVRANA